VNETFDDPGRLIQMLGRTKCRTPRRMAPWSLGCPANAESSEVVRRGTTEVWRMFNSTGDTHPMHFHLVNVQVLCRQPFNVAGYDGTPEFTGPARLPDANELGWKETVRMNPGGVHDDHHAIRRAQRSIPRAGEPAHPRIRVRGRCHILEHEEHDMMRPLIVMP